MMSMHRIGPGKLCLAHGNPVGTSTMPNRPSRVHAISRMAVCWDCRKWLKDLEAFPRQRSLVSAAVQVQCSTLQSWLGWRMVHLSTCGKDRVCDNGVCVWGGVDATRQLTLPACQALHGWEWQLGNYL